MVNGAWVVRATARDSSGRKADAMGAVFLGEKKGDALANELMNHVKPRLSGALS